MKNKLFIVLFVLFCTSFFIGCSSQSPKECTEEAKICPDGSAVERTGPNCEFPSCPENNQNNLMTNACTESDRSKSCSDDDQPVCGWFNQSIKCIKYPCAANYGNPCWACSEPQVEYWTEGPCPE